MDTDILVGEAWTGYFDNLSQDHKVVLMSTCRLLSISSFTYLIALVMELFPAVDLVAHITRRNPATFFYMF